MSVIEVPPSVPAHTAAAPLLLGPLPSPRRSSDGVGREHPPPTADDSRNRAQASRLASVAWAVSRRWAPADCAADCHALFANRHSPGFGGVAWGVTLRTSRHASLTCGVDAATTRQSPGECRLPPPLRVLAGDEKFRGREGEGCGRSKFSSPSHAVGRNCSGKSPFAQAADGLPDTPAQALGGPPTPPDET